jgi:photosystem II stability/assembly factor-like uncharacterized protein
MKKKSKAIFVVLVLFGWLGFTGNGYSQLWKELAKKERPTFLEIKEAAYRFYDNIKSGRKPGFKQFKRWEWFAQQRLDKDGYFDLSHQFLGWLEKEERFPTQEPDISGNLTAQWTSIGPNTTAGIPGAGRLNCIAFDPQNTDHLWVGAPTGGLWKSEDAGQTWSTSTDHLPNLGVSDIVIHPQNSQIMYIATGDKQRGSAHSYGVMKSLDGGSSWQFTGLNPALEQKFKIGKLKMHPLNPETLLCATSEGIYKTTDGGTTWEPKETGNFFDLEVKPGNAAVWFATLSKDGVYRSTDSGETWTRLTTGLPSPGDYIGRIAVAVSPSSPQTVYALYCQDIIGEGWIWGYYGMYRSIDGGDSWDLQSNRPNILGWERDGSDTGGQGGYALVLEVNPEDADLLIAGSVNLWKSSNGGVNWNVIAPGVHVDYHEVAYLPGSSSTLFACNDGGLYRSFNNGVSWTDISSGMVIHQIYRLGLSLREPGQVAVGAQDNGASMLRGNWITLNGGDGMECMIDPNDTRFVYSSWQFGNTLLSRDSGRSNGGIFQDVVGAASWITILEMDPINSKIVYTANNRVYRSENRGDSATPVSPILTGRPMTILRIAPSEPTCLVVSDGRRLFRTLDTGNTWTELDISPFPRYITDIAIHPDNRDILWAAIGGYGRWNSLFTWLDIPYETDKPKLIYSTDGGSSWTDVSGLLPNIPATCIAVDPFSLGVYLGTDLGVFYSASGTGDWQRFDNGLPNVIITEMEIHPTAGKIAAATYGRGLWESPLAVEPAIFPPLYLSGSTAANNSFLQTEYINLLEWDANPKNNDSAGNNTIVNYRLYRIDGQSRSLLAELGPNTYHYMHRRLEGRNYSYALTAVDQQGRESRPLYLTAGIE